MSRSVDIFIDSKKDVGAVVAEVSSLIGLNLPLDKGGTYRHQDTEKLVYLHENFYESDDEFDIPFERYRYVLAIRTRPIWFQNELAAKYWDELASKTPYPLLMTEDTDVVLKQRQ